MKTLNDYTLAELEIELEIRFGKDWKNALIEEEGYDMTIREINSKIWRELIDFNDNRIWNTNGLIYEGGKWASRKLTKLPEKYCVESENKGEYWLYNKEGKIGIAYLLRGCKGYQLVTESQLKRLKKDIPKIGDIGVFWDDRKPDKRCIDRVGWISERQELFNFRNTNGIGFQHFQPITDPDHLEIIKTYLK